MRLSQCFPVRGPCPSARIRAPPAGERVQDHRRWLPARRPDRYPRGGRGFPAPRKSRAGQPCVLQARLAMAALPNGFSAAASTRARGMPERSGRTAATARPRRTGQRHDRHFLAGAKLQHRPPAGREQAGQRRQNAAIGVEPVPAAVERRRQARTAPPPASARRVRRAECRAGCRARGRSGRPAAPPSPRRSRSPFRRGPAPRRCRPRVPPRRRSGPRRPRTRTRTRSAPPTAGSRCRCRDPAHGPRRRDPARSRALPRSRSRFPGGGSVSPGRRQNRGSRIPAGQGSARAAPAPPAVPAPPRSRAHRQSQQDRAAGLPGLRQAHGRGAAATPAPPPRCRPRGAARCRCGAIRRSVPGNGPRTPAFACA